MKNVLIVTVVDLCNSDSWKDPCFKYIISNGFVF